MFSTVCRRILSYITMILFLRKSNWIKSKTSKKGISFVFSLVMLNSNPKNRLKLETCFLLYPSSMVKRVRISTFDFHSRFGDRRSTHIKRSENLTCAQSDSDLCVARLTDAFTTARRHSNTSAVSQANGWGLGKEWGAGVQLVNQLR